MRRIHRLIALVLAALWLPAVVHCGMEGVGDMAAERGCCSHEADTPEASTGACVADHCGVFDEGHYKAESDSFRVVAPAVLVWDVVLAEIWTIVGPVHVAPVPEAGPPPPAGLTRRWMFELRAAPLANAPGLIVG